MNDWIRPLKTSVGSKYLMALTGLGLTLFVIVHMLGNLLVFVGRDALNHPRYGPVIQYVGPVIATVLLIGNCAMPLAVLVGIIG